MAATELFGGYAPEYVTVDGIETRYVRFGEGPPLVFIHGGVVGGSATMNAWDRLFPELKGYEVIAFDRYGCGGTGAPDDPSSFTYDEMLDHVMGTLDALDVDRCHMAGTSFGAGVAVNVALREADRVETLVLTNSGTIAPPSGDPEHRQTLLNRGMPEGDGLETQKARVRYTFETFSHSTDHLTDEYVDTVARMGVEEDAGEMMAAFQGGEMEDFAASLGATIGEAHRSIAAGELQIPTLIVWGRNDLTVPLSAGQALFDMIGQHEPATQLLVFNHAAHLPYREYPAEFAEALDRFVRHNGADQA